MNREQKIALLKGIIAGVVTLESMVKPKSMVMEIRMTGKTHLYNGKPIEEDKLWALAQRHDCTVCICPIGAKFRKQGEPEAANSIAERIFWSPSEGIKFAELQK